MASFSNEQIELLVKAFKDALSNSSSYGSQLSNSILNGNNNNKTNTNSQQSVQQKKPSIFDNDDISTFFDSLRGLKGKLEEESKKMYEGVNDLDKIIKENEKTLKRIRNTKTAGKLEESQQHVLDVLESKQGLLKAERDLQKFHLDEQKTYLDVESKNRRVQKKREEEHIKFQKKYLDDIEKLEKKQAVISKKREEAELKASIERQKGYNETGQATSSKETHELIGNLKSVFTGNSKGRLFGMGVSKLAGGLNSGVSTIMSGKMDVGSMAGSVAGMLSKFGPWGMALGSVVNIGSQLYKQYAELNKAASNYAREVGGGRIEMQKTQEAISKAADEMNKFGKRSYNAIKLIETLGSASKEIGRNLDYISTLDLKALQDLKDFGIDMSTVSFMETLGNTVDNISERFAKLYGESGKRGLNAKAVQETMVKNLKMAQDYNFARGVEALNRMAQKSVELKMNMNAAGQFANKVSSLEGAMTTGANLSVLGGGFARNANPLSMLYESLNDVEGLQDRIVKMTSGMAKWDESKGQFSISAFNRMRMKNAAESMGVDFNDLYNSSMNQARRDKIESQIRGSQNLDDETVNYIKNIATVDKDGIAHVKIGDETKEVSKLTAQDKERLKAESEAKDTKEGAKIGDILTDTRDIGSKLDDIVNVLKGTITRFLGKIAFGNDYNREISKEIGGISDNKEASQQFDKIYDNLKRFKTNRVGSQYNIEHSEGNEREIYEKLGLFNSNGTVNEEVFKYFRNNDNKSELGQKIAKLLNEQIESNKVKKASGGLIHGFGTKTSDSIPTMLSNGEYVVNADSTSKNLELLNTINGNKSSIIKPSKTDQFKSLNVIGNRNMSNSSTDQQKINIEPLKIDMTGTLRLETRDGNYRDVPSKQLLNDPNVIDQLIKQISIRIGYSLNRDNIHQKFG